jgi:uncharacterized membrane protein YkgB
MRVTLSGLGQFLIKDIALLGISLVALGENLGKVANAGLRRP